MREPLVFIIIGVNGKLKQYHKRKKNTLQNCYLASEGAITRRVLKSQVQSSSFLSALSPDVRRNVIFVGFNLPQNNHDTCMCVKRSGIEKNRTALKKTSKTFP